MVLVRAAGCLGVGLLLVAAGAYGQGMDAEVNAASSGEDTAIKKNVTDERAFDARKQTGDEEQQLAVTEARAKLLSDAEALIKEGKPDQAYALLEPFDFERSGEVRFDYLLGISALDSGKADKATLAFERVLAVDPNFAGARLDMARAYFQLGDMTRAKAEFERVMKQNPPKAARITIQKYLEAIAAHEAAKMTQVSAYVEGVLGRDSNLNSGTNSSVAMNSVSPLIAAVVTGLTGDPNPQFQPSLLSDNYYGLNVGGDINHNVDDSWSIFAGANLRQRGNMVQSIYDTSGVNGRIGVGYGAAQDAYRLSFNGGQSYTGNSMRSDSLGVSAEWQHVFSSANQLSAFVQYGENRAAGSPPGAPATDARIEGNIDQALLGVGWVHIMDEGKQALFGSLYLGEEHSPTMRPDGRKNFEGVRIGAQASFRDDIDGFVSLGWQHAAYAAQNFLFIAKRNETQYDLVLGANWRLDALWSLKPQLAFTRKNSNIGLYSFDRTDVSLTLRRDFR